MVHSATSLFLFSQALILCLQPVQLAVVPDEGDKAIFGNPTVTIAQGEVKGSKLESNGERYDRFLAIPYAEPPVGDLRFNAPVAHQGWGSEVYDASVDLSYKLRDKNCLQTTLSRRGTRGSEDCLYLNVWVPGGVEGLHQPFQNLSKVLSGVGWPYATPLSCCQFSGGSCQARKSPLPVMVWIHGGAFLAGSGWGANFLDNWLYDQEPMAMHGNVVAVTLNYRLGALGFISTADDAAPGNYGFLDQVEALKWVKNNIWAFGGDTDRVTIYGESAGAASVSFHMVSPLSQDLFHRGISQSGTVFSSWAVVQDPLKWAHQVAAGVDCDTDDTHAMMECLRAAPAEDVIMALPLLDLSRDIRMDLPWSAVVDGYFLPDHPETLVANSANKDYLLGNNNMDGHLFVGVDFPQINKDKQIMTLSDLEKASKIFHANVPEQVSDAIVFQYRAYTDEVDDTYYKKAVLDVYTDTLFAMGTHLFAQQHASMTRSTGNTFVYLFSHPSKMPLLYPSWMGADHADDLQYVFAKPFRTPRVYTDDERDITEAFMTYWTNFAWSGDPNVGPNGNVVPAYWKPYDLESRSFLEINGSLTRNGDAALQSNFRSDLVAFWTRFVPQLWKSSIGMCSEAEQKANERTTELKCPGDQQFQRNTEYGCVQGETQQWRGIMYSRFLGIPYATPPVGNQRFLYASTPKTWTDVRSATSLSKACPQYPYDASSMSEDCLHLNIYVPVDTTISIDDVTPNKYPVMVWIHGGDFMSGDGGEGYDGGALAAKEKVIVVSFNYRLGSLGFFTTEDYTAPGNYGMFDQNLALQWVRNNIASFSGDPSRIVVFGQGAGAESVQMHSLSPISSQIGIKGAILESGTALTLDEYPDQGSISRELGNRVGCDVSDQANLITCLKSASVESLIQAQIGTSGQSELQFAPVIDNIFLTDTPDNLMKNGNLSSWSFLIGTNSADGTTYWNEVSQVTNGQQFHDFIAVYYATDYGVKTSDIEFEYTLWSDLMFESNEQEIQEQLLNMLTDQHYVAPASRFAESAAAAGSKVYHYQFARVADWSKQQAAYPSWVGSVHGAEVPYVWGEIVKDFSSEGEHPTDALLSYSMMEYWSNFAKTGDPNLDENGLTTDVTWPLYSTDSKRYLSLDETMEASSYLRGKPTEFWNNLLPSLQVTCSVTI